MQQSLPNPQDTQEVLATLSKTSIELAEAASNYGALKVIFGVFLVLVILIIIIFIYQVLALTKKVSNIDQNTEMLTEYIETAGNRAVGTNEAQIIMRRVVNDFSVILKYSVIRVRYENNLEDKASVKAKISQIVDNEWNAMETFLGVFTCKQRSLSVHISNSDAATIKKMVEDCVYNKSDLYAMDNHIALFFEGLKINYLKNI